MNRSIDLTLEERAERGQKRMREEGRWLLSELLDCTDYRLSPIAVEREMAHHEEVAEALEGLQREVGGEEFPYPESLGHHLRRVYSAWAFYCGAKSEEWKSAGGDAELLASLMVISPGIGGVPVTVDGWLKYLSYCDGYRNDIQDVEQLREKLREADEEQLRAEEVLELVAMN